MSQASANRLLVIKLGGLGETLTATPALRAFRASFPDWTIDALVTPTGAAVLSGTGLINQAIVADLPASALPLDLPLRWAWSQGRALRSNGYRRTVLLHHLLTRRTAAAFAALLTTTGGRRTGLDNGRGWFLQDRATDYGFGSRHEVEYWLDVAAAGGARTDDRTLTISRTPEAEDAAEAWMDGLDRPRLAIHAGSGDFGAARRWPVEHFVEVAARVRRVFGAALVLVGGATDRDIHTRLAGHLGPPLFDLTGRTSIPELAAVLARCDVLLANNSGVMHAGAAVGTPTVGVFGPSNSDAWGPWTGVAEAATEETASGLIVSLPPATVVRSEIACSPCFYVARELGRPEGCAARTCLTADLQPAQVGQAVSRYLGARKRALRVTPV